MLRRSPFRFSGASEFKDSLNGYPENRLTFGTRLPSSAFFVRHVNGLVLDNVTVVFKGKDARPAFYSDDAKGIKIRSVFVDDQKLTNEEAVLVHKRSERVEVID